MQVYKYMQGYLGSAASDCMINFFTVWRYASAVLAMVPCLSVCLAVCLSVSIYQSQVVGEVYLNSRTDLADL